MKKILLVIIINNLISFAYASSDACMGYAINSDTILDRIALSKNRDMRVTENILNQELLKCSDQICQQVAKENYLKSSLSISEKEKNAILNAYNNLANLCKN